MYGWYSVKHKSVWLDRFMIDQQYQGKGYAKRFLRLLIQFLQEKFECKIIYLSLHPDNKLAMGLYESFGFRLNGDIDDEGPSCRCCNGVTNRRKYKPVKTGFYYTFINF